MHPFLFAYALISFVIPRSLSGIWNLESGIWNLESGICSRQAPNSNQQINTIRQAPDQKRPLKRSPFTNLYCLVATKQVASVNLINHVF